MKLKFIQRQLCIVSLIAINLFLVSCTRNSNSNDSKISVSFPDWGAIAKSANQKVANSTGASKSDATAMGSSTVQLGLLSINVTGPGVPPGQGYWTWNNDGNGALPPPAVEMVIPRGVDRLVQVIAVYQGSGAFEFYYDSKRVALNSDSVPVDINLKNIASASNLTEGNMVGRFMPTAAGGGPTGRFQYRFTPPGEPSMVLQTGEMFGGWFQIFSLNSNLLQYTDEIGNPILQGWNHSLDTLLGTGPDSPRTARVSIPAGFKNNSNDNVTFNLQAVAASKILVGFYGPGATGKTVCYTNPSGSKPMIDRFYADAAHATPITWSGSTTPAATDAYVESVGGAYGGDSTTNCGNGKIEFTDYIKLNTKSLASSDNVFGFRGPFARVSSMNGWDQYVSLQYDSANQKLIAKWKYLPGAAADLSGIGVFYRQTTDPWNESSIRMGGDGIACNELTNPARVSPVFTMIPAGQGVETADINGIGNVNVASQTQVVLCPRRGDGTYYRSAVATGYNSSGSAMTMGLKLAGTSSSPPSDLWGLLGLVAGTTLGKAQFSYTFANFIPTLGTDFVNATDLDRFEASLDNLAWYNVTASTRNINGANISTFSLANIRSALGASWTSVQSANSSLYLRFKMTAAATAAKNLSTDTFNMPVISLVGTGTCSTLGGLNIVKDDAAHTAYTSTTFLSDLINVANGTDLDFRYRLRYSGAGCSAVDVPLDYINIAPSTSGCFGKDDMSRDASDPFAFHVSPKDSTGADCVLGGASITLADSATQTSVVRTSFSGTDKIIHSTAYGAISVYLADAAGVISNVLSTRLSPKIWIGSSAGSYQLLAVSSNSDGRPVSRNSTLSTAIWNDASNTASLWQSTLAAGSGSQIVQPAASLSNLSASKFISFMVKDSANALVSGNTVVMPHSQTDTIELASDNLWGNQPFFTRQANSVRLWVPYYFNNSGYVGRGLIDLSPAVGFAATSTDRLAFTQINLSSTVGATSFVVGAGNWIQYGVLDPSTQPMSVKFGTKITFANANERVVAIRSHFGSNSKLLVTYDNSTAAEATRVYQLGTPQYDGINVTNPTFASPAVSLDFTNINGLAGMVDFVRCGGGSDSDLFIIGGYSGTTLKLINLNYTAGSFSRGNPIPLTHPGSTAYTKVSCVTDVSGRRHFVMIAPTTVSVSPATFSYDSASGATCGGSAGAAITFTAPTAFTVAGSVMWKDMVGVQSKDGSVSFVGMKSNATAGLTTAYQFAPSASCTGNVMGTWTTNVLGTLPNSGGLMEITSSTLIPGQTNSANNGQSPFDQLVVGGANGFFGQFELK